MPSILPVLGYLTTLMEAQSHNETFTHGIGDSVLPVGDQVAIEPEKGLGQGGHAGVDEAHRRFFQHTVRKSEDTKWVHSQRRLIKERLAEFIKSFQEETNAAWEREHPQPFDREGYLGNYVDTHPAEEEPLVVGRQSLRRRCLYGRQRCAGERQSPELAQGLRGGGVAASQEGEEGQGEQAARHRRTGL